MSYEEVMDYGHLLSSGKKCCLSGRWKPSIQMFEVNMIIESSRNYVKLRDYNIKFYKTNNFIINERGKTRNVKAHHVKDRQLLKSFCEYELKPLLKNRIIPNNSASQKGKGTDYSIRQFKQGLAHMYRKYGRDFYVGTGDLHDYFGSEDHNVIENDICFPDKKSNKILHEYLKCFPGDKGVGIGGEPSQDISVAYTSSIMRMLLCDPKVEDCGIYMDDFYYMCHIKSDARRIMKNIRKMVKKKKLTINEKRTKINYMLRDSVVWLKKRTYLTKTGKIIMRLTKKNIKEEKKRLIFYKQKIDAGIIPREYADISILCWCSYAHSYNAKIDKYKMILFYADLYNVSKTRYKKLFKRHPKNFIITNKKKTKSEKIHYFRKRRQDILSNILFPNI